MRSKLQKEILMKKIWIILMSLSLVISLAGCGEKPAAVAEEKTSEVSVETVETKSAEVEATSTVEENSEEPEVTLGEGVSEEVVEDQITALVYKTGDLTIAMDDLAAPILDEMGAYTDYFEYTGCAGLGLMKYYYFTGIELGTYEDEEGEDRIYSVTFTNDLTETPEGLCIGDPFESAKTIYGAYGEVEDELIVVTIENTRLTILSEEGMVSSIQYLSQAASAKCN